MPSISRLLKLWAWGKALSASSAALYRALSGLAMIVMLVIIVAVLIGATFVGLLFFSYHELLLHGLDRYSALEWMLGVIVLLLAALVGIIWQCWCKMRKVSSWMLNTQMPLSWRVSRVANSFIDGFFESRRPRR